jgi:hypothetical protein
VDVVSLKQRYLSKPYVEPRALRVTLVLSVVYSFVVAVVTLFTVAADLTSNSLEVSLPIRGISLHLNPTLKLYGTSGKLVGGAGFDHATLDFAALGADARIWLAIGHLLAGATFVAVGVTLAILCRRVGQGDPFSALATRAVRTTGVIVLVGGLLWQVCLQVGQRLAIADVFGITAAAWRNTAKGVTPDSVYWPAANGNFGIDFWPIGIGLALFALATVFRYGQKLERDRSELAEEVAGLV